MTRLAVCPGCGERQMARQSGFVRSHTNSTGENCAGVSRAVLDAEAKWLQDRLAIVTTTLSTSAEARAKESRAELRQQTSQAAAGWYQVLRAEASRTKCVHAELEYKGPADGTTPAGGANGLTARPRKARDASSVSELEAAFAAAAKRGTAPAVSDDSKSFDRKVYAISGVRAVSGGAPTLGKRR
jgi:hypothetical protein